MASSSISTPIFCSYEDRPPALIGLKLMIESFLRFHPGSRIICHCPDPPDNLLFWARQHPSLLVDQTALPEMGWAVKPHVLLRHLRDTDGSVVWIDSDIIFTRRTAVFERQSPDGILVAQEPAAIEPVAKDRTTPWGLKVGRVLEFPVNSCLLSVTESHRPLLDAWAGMLADDRFRNAQASTFYDRPDHLAGDQDVLAALLNSDLFAGIPVRFVRSGIDIAQCWFVRGFPAADRWRAIFRGLPPMVHSMGAKPWAAEHSDRLLKRLAMELSPYNSIARKYAGTFPGELTWAWPESKPARILNGLCAGNAAASGLVLMAMVAAYQLATGKGSRA